MYAIVDIAGQQFKVVKYQKIFVHRLEGDEGTKINFEKVLLIDNDKNIIIGEPHIEGALITGKIISHLKGEKVKVFKKKRRKGYRVLTGHRQYLTEIQIEDIVEKSAARKTAVKKEEKQVAADEKITKHEEKAKAGDKIAAKTTKTEAAGKKTATAAKSEEQTKTTAKPKAGTKKTTKSVSSKKSGTSAPAKKSSTAKTGTKKTSKATGAKTAAKKPAAGKPGKGQDK